MKNVGHAAVESPQGSLVVWRLFADASYILVCGWNLLRKGIVHVINEKENSAFSSLDVAGEKENSAFSPDLIPTYWKSRQG